LLPVVWLVACGGGAAPLPAQEWQDISVIVEPHPHPPVAGMNEFIIIANHRDGLPLYDAVISIRLNDQGEWKQAIQDGRTGVYRRAHAVQEPASDVLSVRIKKPDAETVLYFPLATVAPG
jgi:hypothetical protein